jgi:hypothetical protein
VRYAELDEALSVPPTASLEQIDLALRTFVYFCARYYRVSLDLAWFPGFSAEMLSYPR